jgi:hypothetical protein
VLFFFELLLFLLAMLTLGLGEFVSRGLALGLWLACTAASLVGYMLVRGSLSRPLPHPSPPRGGVGEGSDASTRLDDRWNRTLLYTWRRTNALLLFGAIVVGGWYWLGAGG